VAGRWWRGCAGDSGLRTARRSRAARLRGRRRACGHVYRFLRLGRRGKCCNFGRQFARNCGGWWWRGRKRRQRDVSRNGVRRWRWRNATRRQRGIVLGRWRCNVVTRWRPRLVSCGLWRSRWAGGGLLRGIRHRPGY
jgi:hypothetical protein